MIMPKPPRRRVAWPAQCFQASLAGVVAANLTALLPVILDVVLSSGPNRLSPLSFVPVIVLIASIFGVIAGSIALGLGHLVRKIVSLVARSPLAPAVAAGVTVLVFGLAVAVLVAVSGYRFAVWPIVVVTLAGAVLLAWQTYDPARPNGRSSTRNLLEGW